MFPRSLLTAGETVICIYFHGLSATRKNGAKTPPCPRPHVTLDRFVEKEIPAVSTTKNTLSPHVVSAKFFRANENNHGIVSYTKQEQLRRGFSVNKIRFIRY